MTLPRPYYDADGITIFCGDAREIVPNLDEGGVLVTDPPYGLNLGEHGMARDGRRGDHYIGKDRYLGYDDTDANLRGIVVPTVTQALARCVRGVVFCAGGKIGAYPEPACVGSVYMPNAVGRNSWGFQNTIFILFYGIGATVHHGCRATTLVSTDGVEKNGHPCPKPLRWMTWALSLATRGDDWIVDPFAGSGTTLVAARDMGRRAIGIEIEERYCEIAARRLSQRVLALGA